MTMAEFKELKEELKTHTIAEVCEDYHWSVRTLSRVKKARSFKQYKELCH